MPRPRSNGGWWMLSSEVHRWAASGAMHLTGRTDGPPLVGRGQVATLAGSLVAALALGGSSLSGLLGERAAYLGLHRQAPLSCGGAMRILATADGHLAVSLPRADDLALIPALIGADVGDSWADLEAWVAGQSSEAAQAGLHLLGLAGGRVADLGADAQAVEIAPAPEPMPRLTDAPLVVDLTSLWAGPLCGQLLAALGARVVRVENPRRPESPQGGGVEFHRLLNGPKRCVRIDPGTERQTLMDLIGEADLVLDSSRPRAWPQLGIEPEEVVANGTSWLSITARGRSSNTIGFGDDVAACAGLVAFSDGEPCPLGDALADPLTGLTAAVRAAANLGERVPRLIEVSMLAVCLAASSPVPDHHVFRRGGTWWVEDAEGTSEVARPRRRP